MKRNNVTPPNLHSVTSEYRIPVIDKLLGRTTLKWKCDDGHTEELTASLRFTDYEGNRPSLYSIARLPYVAKTYFDAKRSPIMQKPVPFLVLDAIKFLASKVRPGMKVLEVGGGNSSLWFLEQGVDLTTYEHDAEWASFVLNRVKKEPHQYDENNFHLRVMKGTQTHIDLEKQENHSYDIILIDSMNDYTKRNECIRAAMSKIKPGGWLVLDNSDNPVNWLGADLLSGKEMHKFSGFGPMAFFVCQTTFWKM
jgi:predicted O-methyltransferase YrrM